MYFIHTLSIIWCAFIRSSVFCCCVFYPTITCTEKQNNREFREIFHYSVRRQCSQKLKKGSKKNVASLNFCLRTVKMALKSMVMSVLPNSWPKLGPNTFYFCIFGLKMSQLNVKSDTDHPEQISKKSKILNMPKKAQNCPQWPK